MRGERRNFLLLSLNLILWRVGWIFKTESVIMPGFLLNLTGSGAVRGFLPLISNLCRSVPQFLLAHLISSKRVKKWVFLWVSLGPALPWASMAVALKLWPEREALLLTLFLACYALNFTAMGCVTLLSGAMLGKLIKPERRGSLVGISSFIGCISAAVAAYMLMPGWLERGFEGYAFVFGATSLFFLLSALCIPPLEEPEGVEVEGVSLPKFVAESFGALRSDPDFRRLICAALLLQVNSIIFPHYTAYGREVLGVRQGSYVLYLIVQNLTNAFNSLLMGAVADRRGNRAALKAAGSLRGLIPLVALILGSLPGDAGVRLFPLVYAFIGFAHITPRLMVNLILELTPPERHPAYLGAFNLLRIAPIFAAPLAGWMIDLLSYEPVFLLASALIFAGVWMISRVKEPRFRR